MNETVKIATHRQACAKAFLLILTTETGLPVVPTSMQAKTVARYDIAMDNKRYNHLVLMYGGHA